MQGIPINSNLVKQQLKELGYDPATIHPDIIKQFVEELREELPSFTVSVDQDLLPLQMEGSFVTEKPRKLQNVDLSKVRQVVQEQQLEYQESEVDSDHVSFVSSIQTKSGYIKTTAPKTYKKKADPVSRFHQHKAAWEQDSFLKRQEKNQSVRTGRWGGLVVAEPEPKKKSQTTRPSYVTPSEKSRRDIIWDIRNKMA